MFFLILEFIGLFIFLWFVSFATYQYFLTPKPKKLQVSNYKPDGFFKKFFIQLPRCIGRDIALYDGSFRESGLILFEGAQGSGKTISMTKLCYDLKMKYPEILIYSNYGLSFEDANLDSWEPIVGELNGALGMIACFDEISLWFSNRNYKDFPPDLLRTIVQNRKEHRLIVGSCQQVNMVDKQIRRQCTEVRQARSFGAFTLVWRKKPVFSSDGDIIRYASLGLYWFVQTDKLRSFYDTYRVVENLKKIGFQERKDIGYEKY